MRRCRPGSAYAGLPTMALTCVILVYVFQKSKNRTLTQACCALEAASCGPSANPIAPYTRTVWVSKTNPDSAFSFENKGFTPSDQMGRRAKKTMHTSPCSAC